MYYIIKMDALRQKNFPFATIVRGYNGSLLISVKRKLKYRNDLPSYEIRFSFIICPWRLFPPQKFVLHLIKIT